MYRMLHACSVVLMCCGVELARLPLHVACFAGQQRVVAVLLACHADPNAASSSKQTALHVCSMKGEVACAVALAYAGCR